MMIFDKDEYGNWLCPLLDAELNWDEGGNERRRVSKKCRSPLHLVFEGDIPVSADLTLQTFNPVDCVTTAWRVECENRHVLLLSAGDESAEPFQIDFLIASERADQ